MNPKTDPDRLLSLRAAFILTASSFVGENAGVLAFMAHHSVPEAVIASAAAIGTAIALFVGLINLSGQRRLVIAADASERRRPGCCRACLWRVRRLR